jgi:hypothetical protein
VKGRRRALQWGARAGGAWSGKQRQRGPGGGWLQEPQAPLAAAAAAAHLATEPTKPQRRGTGLGAMAGWVYWKDAW